MPRRLKFVVAYDGAPFAGWQSQSNGNAVQDHLERAFAIIVGAGVRVHGAGRTDAGVHALAQIAHADLANDSLDAKQWPAALNSSLPPSIRVLRSRYVDAKFHAQFSARGKLYRYRIWNESILPPLEVGRVWHVPSPLHFQAMASEARAFQGRHDFASFAANRGQPKEDTFRIIDSVRVRQRGRCITVEVSGDGFLYRMVRMMVGALVRCGRDQGAIGEIRERLSSPTRVASAARVVAPAGGLFLVRVRY